MAARVQLLSDQKFTLLEDWNDNIFCEEVTCESNLTEKVSITLQNKSTKQLLFIITSINTKRIIDNITNQNITCVCVPQEAPQED